MFPLTPHYRRSLNAAFRRGCWLVTVLCVCLAQWHAPLPWLHAHNLDAASSSHLLRHMDAWHQDTVTDDFATVGDALSDLVAPEAASGWHWHVAFLEDILRGGGCPVPDDDPTDSVPEPGLRGVMDEISRVDLRDVAAQSSAVPCVISNHAALIRDVRCVRQIIGQVSPVHRLTTMLCVIRC